MTYTLLPPALTWLNRQGASCQGLARPGWVSAPPFTSSLSYCCPSALGTHSWHTHPHSDQSDSQRKQESELISSLLFQPHSPGFSKRRQMVEDESLGSGVRETWVQILLSTCSSVTSSKAFPLSGKHCTIERVIFSCREFSFIYKYFHLSPSFHPHKEVAGPGCVPFTHEE